MEQFEKLLKTFEDAAIALSWAGASPPEDGPLIRSAYTRAKKDLYSYVLDLNDAARM